VGHCEPLRRLLVRPVPVGPSSSWRGRTVRSAGPPPPLLLSVPPPLGASLLRWARFSFAGRASPSVVGSLLRWSCSSSAGRVPPPLVALLLCWSRSSFAGRAPPLLVALLLCWSRSSSAGRAPPPLVAFLLRWSRCSVSCVTFFVLVLRADGPCWFVPRLLLLRLHPRLCQWPFWPPLSFVSSPSPRLLGRGPVAAFSCSSVAP